MLNSLLTGLVTMLAVGNTFTNPVAPDGEDPWVIKHEGMYYYVFASGPNHMGEYSRDNAVWIRGSDSLLDVFTTPLTAQAWRPPSGKQFSEEIWHRNCTISTARGTCTWPPTTGEMRTIACRFCVARTPTHADRSNIWAS
jgi:hypothetical protein